MPRTGRSPSERARRRVELQLVTGRIGLLREVARIGLAVAARRDVRPARDAEGVDVSGKLVAGLDDHDLGAGPLEGVDVAPARRE